MAQLQLGVQPGLHAPLHQLQHFGALLQRALGHGALGLQACQLEVALRHAAREQQARGLGVGARGLGLAQCGGEGGTVFAEEVQLPAARQAGGFHATNGAGLAGGVGSVGAVALARGVQAAVDLRALGRAGGVGKGLGARDAGGGLLQPGVALQGLGDERIQLRIAKAAPPVGGDRSLRLHSSICAG